MNRPLPLVILLLALAGTAAAQNQTAAAPAAANAWAVVNLTSASWPATDPAGPSLTLDGWFYETAAGQVPLPAQLSLQPKSDVTNTFEAKHTMPDGHAITLTVKPEGKNFTISLTAQPNTDIVRWGVAVAAAPDEYYTGVMEKLVDGAQTLSWAAGRTEALNLRGQSIRMLMSPTLATYAPFYISSRGYGLFVKGSWPGQLDFCSTDAKRVWVQFEGPAFELKIYTADNPGTLISAHAMDAGAPILPPKWLYQPWRWRDEHRNPATFYEGTPVTGGFNSNALEDLLMMKAFGIPCGVYWIDRPWGPGRQGYNDFEIDAARLPHFPEMIKWLDEQNIKMVLWIGPFVNGAMAQEAFAKGYNFPGQTDNGNYEATNFPLIDFTNPEAKAFFQAGVAKLLKLGVAGFKLDRSEENIPSNGTLKMADGRTLWETRNIYPVQYLKATYEIARQIRGDDFVCMPRSAYTGSSQYGVFWGGDIGSNQEGLRSSIIAVQRNAVMGYPNWGSDTCGYNAQNQQVHDTCARWLAFSCFTPIMEVGPTKDLAFWSMTLQDRDSTYDAELIAVWRLYARLHSRLADYSYEQAQLAHKSGVPIVRPLFMADPKAPAAWANWWTYQYGPDIVVAPVWQREQRTQEVYLPAGQQWRDAWNPDKVYAGGQTITVTAALHQIPIFTRVGSSLPIGDLNKEWAESQEITRTPPDLKNLDAGVKVWLDNYLAKTAATR